MALNGGTEDYLIPGTEALNLHHLETFRAIGKRYCQKLAYGEPAHPVEMAVELRSDGRQAKCHPCLLARFWTLSSEE